MTCKPVLVILTLGGLAIAQEADPTPKLYYFPRAIDTSNGPMPACAPLIAPRTARVSMENGVVRREVVLDSPFGTWSLPIEDVAERIETSSSSRTIDLGPYLHDFAECLAGVSDYSGRYSEKQRNLVSEGSLEAAMPVEFAFMVLGPPTQPPGSVSLLNQTTGKVEWHTTYTWDAAEKHKDLAFTFTLASAFALGVAGVSSDYTTMRNALTAAALAEIGATLADELLARGAATVTAEVDGADTIRTLSFSIAPLETPGKEEEGEKQKKEKE